MHSRSSHRRSRPSSRLDLPPASTPSLCDASISSGISSLSSRSAWRRVVSSKSEADRKDAPRGTLLLLLAILAVLHLDLDRPAADEETRRRSLEARHKSYYASFTHDSSLSVARDGDGRSSSDAAHDNEPSMEGHDEQMIEPSDSEEELAESLQFHRLLQAAFAPDVAIPVDMIDDESNDADAAESTTTSSLSSITSYNSLLSTSSPLPHYTLSSCLDQISTYRTAYALLIYDPQSDQFVTLYSRKLVWSSAVGKLLRAMHSFTYLLRLEFGDLLELKRQTGQEVVIPVSSGDYPLIADTDCVGRNLGEHHGVCVDYRGGGLTVNDEDGRGERMMDFGLAPILHFGSVFSRPMYPNMIAMPPPESHHLNCFEQWATSTTVCSALNAKSQDNPKGELIFAKEFGIKWRDLKEQVVWRGTDFGYLGFVHPTMKRPSQSNVKIRPEKDDKRPIIKAASSSSLLSKKEQALSDLQQDFDNLVPRWKGVIHTAQAELELEREIEETARGENEARQLKQKMIPWANIKFSQFIGDQGVKAPTVGSKEYMQWESIGFPAVGESMSLEELAKYKYHIDLGGGGGTTWSGTLHKLAFPGLLFHHVTPTKDYFHEYMKPWKHYVPVAPDLVDLKEKFDWAQSHPKKAFQIARNGSELMRFLTSPKGMEERYQKDILDPLRAVMEAYVPLSQTKEYKDKSWKEVLTELEGAGNMLPILKCTGESSTSCETIVGKEAFLDRKALRRVTNAGGFDTKETSAPQRNKKQLAPWAHQFFADVNKKPDASRETALFWHIPKSGGTTVKNLYHCTGQTMAHRGGVDPKFGHDRKDELVVFQPMEKKSGKFVNVDTTIKEGILRAKKLGLVQSHISDIIFTMEPTFAGQNLYDKKNKGRILALFRHPVERMVSKFYYLQAADWERGYRPDWKDISLMEWIEKAELKDDNLIVRKLVGKSYSEPIDETDLMHAKAILRRRVVVGLMNKMEESVHRFNIVLGIDESLETNRQCMNEYFGKSNEKNGGIKNSNKHPKVVETSPEWQLLAEKEWLDMKLYAYAEQLFEDQKETIYSYM